MSNWIFGIGLTLAWIGIVLFVIASFGVMGTTLAWILWAVGAALSASVILPGLAQRVIWAYKHGVIRWF